MVSVQRHLAVLRSALQPGESERVWIRAERAEKKHSGALVLTDRRLLFSGFGFVSQSQEAWPLAIVSGVHRTLEAIELRILGTPEAFTGKAKDLQRLADLLPRTEQTDASVADELERLVRLHDAGALTDVEFEGAKRRLLE